MCGIVGVVGIARDATPLVFEALRRLEYRGYDSAGIATLVNGHIERRRAEGKLDNLAGVLERRPLPGVTAIGHTRWATHGAPTEGNAHPHGTGRVSVVHNGIIENHAELRAELEAQGQVFSTETDTETVAQLVDLNLRRGMAPREAAHDCFRRLQGAYALAMIFAGHPEMMIGARHGAPLAVGFGDDEMFLGSDSLALAPLTRRIAYLRDGDWAVLSRSGAAFFDEAGEPAPFEIKQSALPGGSIGKDGYRHYMEKELHEHPLVIGQTLQRMIDPATRRVVMPPLPFELATVPRMTVTACGSAFYAGLIGRNWIEAEARVPVDADVASELRYRDAPMTAGGAGSDDQPVRRDRRHAGGAAFAAGRRPACAVGAERRREHDGARKRRGAGHRGGSGDLRRQHQGVHRPVVGAGLPGDCHRPCARHHERGARG